MRKILFIVGSLPPMECGVGYYTASLLEHLVEHEKNLTVMTTAARGELDDKVGLLSVPGWRLRDLPKLVRSCKQAQADIIHIQYPAKGYGRQLGINLLPWLLRILVRQSYLVITLHEYSSSPILGRCRDFITVVPAQTVILSNQADRHTLPRFISKKARIIPIGSSIETVRPNIVAASKLIGAKDAASTLLFFGFAFPSKQLDILVAAMQALPAKRLVVASSLNQQDNYQRELSRRINSHNQSVGYDQIKVIGFQPREVLAALLQQAFCFVLPQASPLNTKSSTVVTALRYDSLIVGKRGQNWENDPFVDKQNALLLDQITPQSIAAAVMALDDPGLRATIKKSLAQLAENYSWTAITKQHETLYTEITGE